MSDIYHTPAARLLRTLVEQLRHFPKPWPSIPEKEQEQHIERMATNVRTALIEAVTAISGGGFQHYGAKIESFAVKDGVKLTLKLSSDAEHIEALVAHVGRFAVLVLAPDAESYLNGLEAVKADPDQPALELGSDDETQESPALGEGGEGGTEVVSPGEEGDGTDEGAERPADDDGQTNDGVGKPPGDDEPLTSADL